MLYIFGGLPGTGKSTLAAALARRSNAVYLRIDTIEQAVRDCGLSGDGPVGYNVGYKLAGENLGLGSSVVVDSVNPMGLTRKAWREVAVHASVSFVEIELICSDREEHRNRVESRRSNIPGHRVPTWDEVLEREREYEAWITDHIVLDTAGQTVDASTFHLFDAVDNWRLRL
jgi:predicted kinase